MKNKRRTLINESWVIAGEVHTIKRMVLLALCLLVPASTQPLLADIINGDFSSGLSGWTASDDCLVYEYDGWAVLRLDIEGGLLCSTLSQNEIYLQPSDRWLSLDLVMTKIGGGDETDEFTATFGLAGSSPSPSPFYALRSSDFVGDSYSETVTFDLAGLPIGPLYEYELLFKLTNIHPDGPTSVAIDNVRLSPVPVPGAVALGSLGVGFAGWMLRRRAR